MKSFALLIALGFVTGCTFEASDPSDEYGEEEDLGTALSAVNIENAMEFNALNPNGLAPNGLAPNGLAPNGLTPTAVSGSVMTALQNPGPAGTLSRLLMKYVVGCALLPAQNFTFDWVDDQSNNHHEVLTGALGLATEWTGGALSPLKARLVTACVASRTNYYAVPVLISLRGTTSALAASSGEKATFFHMEGAFWGDLFQGTPVLKSCYNSAKVAYARSKNRACAAGHFQDPNTFGCGILMIAGSCSTMCNLAADPEDGYADCEGNTEVITTFLD